MKSTLCSTLLKTVLLIVPLSLYFRGTTIAQAGDGPANLNYRAEVRQGYLKVYSATDEFNDGDAWYFPHSSYAIYSIDGKVFKNVENHISRSDEIPQVVMLPVGFYMVDARSEQDGYVRIPVVIKEGQQTILHLDLREDKTLRRLVHN